MYDMLPDEFQKQIIVIVAVAVTLATTVAHVMVIRKNIKKVWK